MGKRALVVVDYQNDFVNGTLGFAKAVELENGIAEKVKEYMDNGEEVIFTLDTHYSDYLDTQEGKKLPVEHCIVNTEGHKLYGKLDKLANELNGKSNAAFLNKVTFGSSELMRILKAIDKMGTIDSVEFCGIVTNMCVISNAVIAKAALPEAEIIINKDLCASFNDDLHNKAIEVMESMQMTIK